MAQQVVLYIDTTANRLVSGLSSPSPIAASSIPLFFGDTISLKVYLLDKNPNANPTTTNPYAPINLSGLQLQLYIDNGLVTSPTIYTQQVTFNVNSTNASSQFFYADLALNTTPLQTLISNAGGISAQAYLKIGYVQSAVATTVLSQQVTIGVGLPSAALSVPAGQTALTVEVANNTFVPLQPLAGQPIQLMSGLGKVLVLYAKDEADGSVTFQATPTG